MQPFQEVKGKNEAQPPSLRVLDYKATYKALWIVLIYPVSPFPTPMEIPKVWIYSVRSKSVAPITDKTEFVIQQILRL